MDISEFNFTLPSDLIAQYPLYPRDESKLLSVVNGRYENLFFTNLPDLLSSGDIIVINDTKVIKANLNGKIKEKKVNITLHYCKDKKYWMAFCKPSKKCKERDVIEFENKVSAKIEKKFSYGEILLKFNISYLDLMKYLSRFGSMPLPPYIKNKSPNDAKNYQTIFAKKHGAIAAPTAGFHFTEPVIKNIKEKGIKVVSITLHVGAGTFLPVKTKNIEDHKMHSEFFEVSKETSDVINEAKLNKRKIVCVGTTTLRALETIALSNNIIIPCKGNTDLYIMPGFKFKIADYLITNFHFPKSTLLILISAFYGKKNVMKLYEYAIENQYRFFSYGDCCILPQAGSKK